MYKSWFLILLIPVLSFGQAQLIDEDVMPFGGYSSHGAYHQTFYSNSCLELMHNSLGINQFTAKGFYYSNCSLFAHYGIYSYPPGTGVGPIVEPQTRYAHTTYFITHPESDSSSRYRTKFTNGSNVWDVVWHDSSCLADSSDTTMLMLENLQLNLYNKMNCISDDQLEYYPYLMIGRSSTWADSSDSVIGVFNAARNDTSSDHVRFADTIKIDEVPADSIILLSMKNDLISSNTNGEHFFTVFDSEDSTKSRWVGFDFETAGNCTVYVDYFLVHDLDGGDLMEGDADDRIKESVSREGFKGNILGWFIRDTVRPTNYCPVGYIDNLIKAAMDESDWADLLKVRAISWEHMGYGFRDHALICPPDILWAYLYPLNLDTEYTGYGSDPDANFQKALEHYLTVPCDSIRAILEDPEIDSINGWMYGPQYWFCDPNYTEDRCEGTNLEERRKPTRSEMRCFTFIGLCYHPMGIMFWKYDSTDPSKGIVKEDGTPREGMYEAVKDDINPYIKAIDEYYMPLTWDAAYVCSTSSQILPGLVKSVSGYSDTTNPDLGWFHVGEYEDDSHDKYFMLVNRACNIDSATLAPDVTAIVELNRSQFDNTEQLLVIDIAHEVDTSWAAIPETTYTAIIPDSKLYYTTVLKAGEGRLFKVIETNKE